MAVELSAFERSPRFSRWLDRRIPPSRKLTLSQQSIFIFPTVTGFLFGGLIVLLILGAINYQNSLVYGVAFTLGSLFLVTILYTFRNLSGLTIELIAASTGFVGEDVEFQVRISRSKGKGREGIQLGWLGAIAQWAELYDSEACTVVCSCRQGRMAGSGRLLIGPSTRSACCGRGRGSTSARAPCIHSRCSSINPSTPRRGEEQLMDRRRRRLQRHAYVSSRRSGAASDRRVYALDQPVVKGTRGYLDPRLMLDYDASPAALRTIVG
jgi:hypothetical protein